MGSVDMTNLGLHNTHIDSLCSRTCDICGCSVSVVRRMMPTHIRVNPSDQRYCIEVVCLKCQHPHGGVSNLTDFEARELIKMRQH